jgi:hypothetical protein
LIGVNAAPKPEADTDAPDCRSRIVTQPKTKTPPSPQHRKPTSKPVLTIKDIDSIRELRDELLLQAHLFKAELKDGWDEAEIQWHQLQKKLEPLRDAAQKSGLEVGFAVTLLAETLRNAYQELRRALPKR